MKGAVAVALWSSIPRLQPGPVPHAAEVAVPRSVYPVPAVAV